MLLVKNIEVYAPKYLGVKDVLLSNKIEAIADTIDINEDFIEIIDGSGKKLIPGFIDNHVHITGGGGEGSFKTRVPESMLSDFTTCGITTVVGLLGTDGTTRSVENLIAKAKALKEEGLNVYAYTGSYEIPTITLTDSIRKDITFIDEIIGVKIAMSDHRSSMITKEEFARVASDARVAGMLSGKGGTICMHMGDCKHGLDFLFELLDDTALPIKIFRPTHVSRNEKLFDDSIKFAKLGGYIDITAESSPIKAIQKTIEAGVDQSRITISSDGYGSWSTYDEDGNLDKIGVQTVRILYKVFQRIVKEANFSIEDALQYFTSNCADALKINGKGSLKVNNDSDVLIINDDLEIETVIIGGVKHVEDKKLLIKGTYEKN